MFDDVSALILAGGKATRLGGAAKHELVIDGKSILARQVEVLAPRVADIVVSSPQPIAGFRTVADTLVDGGPLAGIAAGFTAVTTSWMLVVAGDMPFLSGPLIDALCTRRVLAADAVGIDLGGVPQPLCCLLDCTTVPPLLDALLAAGERKASRLLTAPLMAVDWITEAELRAFDPELRCLANINTEGDLAPLVS